MAEEPTTGFYENPWGQEPTTIIFPEKKAGDGIKSFLFDATVNITTSASGSLTRFPIERGSIISDHFQPEQLKVEISGIISESPSNVLLTLASNIASFQASQLISNRKYTSIQTSLAAIAAGAVGTIPYLIASKFMASDKLSGFTDKGQADYVEILTSRVTKYGVTIPDKNYPKKAMKALVEMLNAGEVFTIRTHFSEELYTDMIMTNISFPQEATVGNSLIFNMSCRKVKIVDRIKQRGDQFKSVGDLSPSITPNQSKGPKKPKAVEPPSEDNLKNSKGSNTDPSSWLSRQWDAIFGK